MAGGFAPGPWDQGTDQYSTADGTMCRIPSPVPGWLQPAEENMCRLPPKPPPPALNLTVIGSPSPDQKFPFQFVNAAECRPRDALSIWLVEKSGYESYGASLEYIKKAAPAGGYGWITEKEPLVGWLNSMPQGSIKSLFVYSHGLRGLIALRYGWDKLANYGLKEDEVTLIDPDRFAHDPSIEFDSCNSGVPESTKAVGVAQALANRLHASVRAWTGRTSYAGVNQGDCTVRGSAQTRNPLAKETWSELYSRWKAGGAPEFKVFQPNQ
jgi:hypothetical protein